MYFPGTIGRLLRSTDVPDSPELRGKGRDQRCVLFDTDPPCKGVPEGVLAVLNLSQREVTGILSRRSSAGTGEHAVCSTGYTIHIDRRASDPDTESCWRRHIPLTPHGPGSEPFTPIFPAMKRKSCSGISTRPNRKTYPHAFLFLMKPRSGTSGSIRTSCAGM